MSSDRGEPWPFEPIRILPDGTSELLVSVTAVERPAERETVEAALYGLKTRPLVVHPRVPTDNVSVRFRPGGASRLFPFPAHELTDASVALGELCGRGGTELVERLREAGGPVSRLQLLQEVLLARLPQASGEGTVDEAIDLVFRSRGRLRVRELARRTGASVRRLERLFRRHLGVGPKRFARIVRFRATLQELRKGRDHARVAVEAGYADQAHMVRELRALGGVTPRTFARLGVTGSAALAAASR